MFRHAPRFTATRLAITVGTTLVGAGLVALVKRLVDAPRGFLASPLWPRPDGSLPSAPRHRSYGLVWDHGEEHGAVDETSA